MQPVKLRTLLGDHPGTLALKQGKVSSELVQLDFADVRVPNTAFKRVVRELEFDVAELAIVTFLMARAHGKPLVLLPAVVLGRFQHPYIVYNAERGLLSPADLAGRRVAIRSYSVTTAAWIRGILANDFGLDIDKVEWVTFEEPHVAEYRDPPNAVRAAPGANPLDMLLRGDVDAAVVGDLNHGDARLKPLFPDPQAEALAWHRRHGAPQINHMVVVKSSVSQAQPDAVRETYRLLLESRQAAGMPDAQRIDHTPFGVEAVRPGLDVIIEYVHQQRLIPRRYSVDELFDDVTGALGR
jgi:4,5-dihydroxyphthalate decarboxylase